MNRDGITRRGNRVRSVLLDWTAVLFLLCYDKIKRLGLFIFLPGTTLGPLAMDDPADP